MMLTADDAYATDTIVYTGTKLCKRMNSTHPLSFLRILDVTLSLWTRAPSLLTPMHAVEHWNESFWVHACVGLYLCDFNRLR